MKRLILVLCFVSCGLAAKAQYTLEQCQTMAYENYPLIKRYNLLELSTEYSVSNAAKAYLPQVSFSAQATYQNEVPELPEFMSSLPGVAVEGLNKDQYKVAVEVNQVIWDGGLTNARKNVLEAEGDVSVQSLETEMYALRNRVNQLYLGILMFEEQLKQNTLLQELLQSNYERAKAYVENGVAMSSDLNLIKAEQLSISQQRVKIENASNSYRQMLAIMTGVETIQSAMFERPVPEVVPQDMSTINGRPELKLFEAQERLFENQKKVIKSSLMPNIGLFAQGFYGNPGFDFFQAMSNNEWSWNYMAGVRLQWNIGSFYTKKGNMQKLTISQQQVDNQRELFLFNSTLQQTKQQNEVKQMLKIMADDDEIIKLRTVVRQASEAKFANGTITAAELLHDITAENKAILMKSLHELEWLKNIYDLKNTTNN